jgi:bacteriocin biosynthesis cyclodehydratase domain-containing protein
MKPRLLSHLTMRVEPPGSDGEETLVFTSKRRRIAIKGHSFREFAEKVVPLLNGRQTLAEIQARVVETFTAGDVADAIGLLHQNNLIEDAESWSAAASPADWRDPQSAYFRELGESPARLQEKLHASNVAVFGLGPLGAVVASSLAASGVRRISCIDREPVMPSDTFLAQCLTLADVGRPRTEAVRDRLAAIDPAVRVDIVGDVLKSDADVLGALRGMDLVIGCLDPGHASLSYKLNRAVLAARIPCCFGDVSAFEGVVGPTVIPFESACYLCYQMRLVACAEDPEDAFASLHYQDQRAVDDSPRRENLPFCAGAVGSMMGLEGFKLLLGGRSSTIGSILAFDFTRGRTSRHVVLRKPWCPACFAPDAAEQRTTVT